MNIDMETKREAKNLEEFINLYLKIVNRGWWANRGNKDVNVTEDLRAAVSDRDRMAWAFRVAKLRAYRNCISLHDSVYTMIAEGKI